MSVDKLSSYVSRISCGFSAILFVGAFLEWIGQRVSLGISTRYEPSHLVEFAGIFLLPVITVLLRQIRGELRKKG